MRVENSVLPSIRRNKDVLSTPLYLYDEYEIISAIENFKSLYPKNSKLFYSLKANPNPSLASFFYAKGLGIEITGQGEWEICKDAGIPTTEILCGGVSKSSEFLLQICRQNPRAVVIDSLTEWTRLLEILPRVKSVVRILLRINPGISFGGLNMAGGSQFGLSYAQAIEIFKSCRNYALIDLLGLHFYFGSQRLKASPIIEAIEHVERIIEQFTIENIPLRVIDLGLGCGVPYNNAEEELDRQGLKEELSTIWNGSVWKNIEIWGEAGRALIAPSGYFIAKVIERKELNNQTFIFLDGGLNVHNPGFGLGRVIRKNPNFYFITKETEGNRGLVNIVGNLCTSSDCFAQNLLAPNFEENDLIIIPNSGAYAMTTSMLGFNSQPPFHEALLKPDETIEMIQSQAQ